MNEQLEHAKRVITDAASNPKVATVIGVGSASAGGASQLSIISGWFADLGVILGTCTTAVVLIIQLIKSAREWREFQGVKRRGKR